MLHTRKVAGSIPAGTTTNLLLEASFAKYMDDDAIAELIEAERTNQKIAVRHSLTGRTDKRTHRQQHGVAVAALSCSSVVPNVSESANTV